jgi:hypothetical protein
LQEQKLADIASIVASRPGSHRVRVIAIAGPTSRYYTLIDTNTTAA